MRITGLPKYGVDPTQFFVGKEKDRELANQMKEKYNMMKKKRVYDVVSINNNGVCFITKSLASKFLRKCWPNQVLVAMIVVAE